jgi:hypothetical protein
VEQVRRVSGVVTLTSLLVAAPPNAADTPQKLTMLSAIVAFISLLALQANAQDQDFEPIESIGDNIRFDAAHNATTIIGTWSSGSQHVQTGSVRIILI